MDYLQAVEWVHGLPRIARHCGVENTKLLLEKLGHPEKDLRFVHISGTNGKGSTTVMLASVLKAAGYKVGCNISPYVLDFRERFLLNGEMASEEVVARCLSQVRMAIEELQEEGWDSIVEFDAVTTAALLWYAQEKCDIVCLETGLGGRLDSTNAVQNTLVACIMSIGKDHTELLGDTYEKIAFEKCGILKNDCAAVIYPVQPQQAMDEITLRTQQMNCSKVVVPELEDFYFYKGKPFENRINYGGYDLEIPFPGKHQAYNASVVVEAAIALSEKGVPVSDEAIIEGIRKAKFPARIEVISKEPLVILDGAHNEDGARALADTLRLANVQNLTAVIGILHGKGADRMLQILSPYISELYTVSPDNPRAMTAQELADIAQKYYPKVTAMPTVSHALQAAQQKSFGGLLICGSLYLASEARKFFVR
ncbi:folylpolyglutamate synthase/dihydrofolate synthase family protein [uncultured Ruthenibacterium sp.]|uniref:bifunctional folylpolyglutamate synthase/dihydrofolate synthase n=1 Tax=uncultured Ruthenibacterium sp. TaxID=1905347 RepID=UPI00349E9988